MTEKHTPPAYVTKSPILLAKWHTICQEAARLDAECSTAYNNGEYSYTYMLYIDDDIFKHMPWYDYVEMHRISELINMLPTNEYINRIRVVMSETCDPGYIEETTFNHLKRLCEEKYEAAKAVHISHYQRTVLKF
jgi:hypothetical protein